ncbi:glycosyltransferase family 2 protein [Mucilaginibacter sp. BJC16-A38]|uniref:glycosyltransferase family 2 protein n=1 Tax=Mucilaginibacter phenanthrenivorans TaxID=1234842 RepID=UPI0021581354|nr:glycosyltransferase family 2 protein [Mucilaginibacter phenanthrenivorans]MCR8558593.1 glycosyltransferase family 2 protein [Mucilaginibacter phenanthrenivorans]
MEQTPLVSIALCTYNGAKYLAEQLDSLIGQTYKSIEIIVVDDCSTDETYSILTAYADKYPQFKIHRNDNNLGFTGNFERAVSLCNGGLIALCDQDDVWMLDKIALQVEAIGDSLLIYHDSEFVHEDGSSMDRKMSDLMNLYRGDDPEAFLFFNCVSGHAVLMRRELLQDALPLKKEFFHDWWLAYVATNIGKIDFIPQCLVKYRQHNKSDTNILKIKREKNAYRFDSIQKIEREYKWLGYCAAFKNNKRQALVSAIYQAYTKRLNNHVSFALSRLLYKYRNTIFFIRKKSSLSKLNYIFGRIWGVKTKRHFMNFD